MASTTPPIVLQLAVPTPLYASFDYLLPAGCNPAVLQPGMRLRLPFGRSQVVGILLAVGHESRIDVGRLRPATRLLDSHPLLGPDLLALGRWAAHYYHHPIGEVFAALLPSLLRQGKQPDEADDVGWHLTAAGRAADPAELVRAPRQAALLRHLQLHADGGLSAEQLTEQGTSARAALRALMGKGWVKECAAPVFVPAVQAAPGALDLNAAQRAAVTEVCAALHRYKPFVVEGVTGSGKTEVYLDIIDRVATAGAQALVLVPEIGLTPQLVARFAARLRHPMVVLHSGLTDRQRLQAWHAAATGAAKVIVGTRSAVFTPLPRPGVIIIDEEHDVSLKQQDGFRYHARDVAVWRANHLGVPVVLGSATPSLETLYNVERGRYQRLHLPQRAGDARPPTLRIIDVRHRPLAGNLSEALLQIVKAHLQRGHQALLFLNRRGYAPTLLCHDCGWVARCQRCDAHLIYHQSQRRLRCHHCGGEQKAEPHCPACSSDELRALGHGTERVEQVLREHFPDHAIARIDRDSTRRKGSLQQLLDAAQRGEYPLLIGTQMLAKGHHLPKVTLAAILDADQGLFSVDFRAGETLAQLIIQVAGRAGRAEHAGEVLIQTHHPEHPLLRTLLAEGYASFASAALVERRAAALPPYTHMALLRAEASAAELPQRFLAAALALAQQGKHGGVELLGPVPAPMERRAGRYRAQLLLQATARGELHRLLDAWLPQFSALPLARKVRWSIDVDPMDLS